MLWPSAAVRYERRLHSGSSCKHLWRITDKKLRSNETTESSKVLPHCLDTLPASVPALHTHTHTHTHNHSLTHTLSTTLSLHWQLHFHSERLLQAGQSPDCVEGWWRQSPSIPCALEEEEASLGLPPLTSQASGSQEEEHKRIHSSHSIPRIVKKQK